MKEMTKETATKPTFQKEKFKEALEVFAYIKPYKWSLIFGLLLLALSSMVFMIFPFLSGKMVDIAQGKGEGNWTLTDMGWILLAVLLAQGVVSYLRVILFANVSEKGIADVRKAVYKKMISLPIFFFEQTKSGELISRLTADVEKLYSAFSITLAEFIRQVIILIAGIGFLAWTTPKLAGIMLLTFPVIVLGAMFFGRYIRKMSKERQEALAETNSLLGESIQAIQVVKAFTNEWYENMRYGKAISDTVDISLKYARTRALFATFIITFVFGALFFIIYQGASMLQSGEMTAGQLISFVVYTGVIGGSIAGLGNFYTELIGALGATERIREILQTESEVPVGDAAPVFKTLKGNIVFDNLVFEYPGRKDVPVLKGISFEVKPGEKVALVGSSGAGKSTIMQLLLKYYPYEKGDITIDGQSLSTMDTPGLRQNIAVVPQEVILFGGTILENILYGRPKASEADVILAAQQANAWDFIQGFPEGLQTIVGERGVKLSGGQRQRIAIARAILKDPTILLLDEATSALDADSERVVQEALDRLMEGRTSIIIAHRLATIREVDTIYVIEDGQIAESGSHQELSMKENGIYNHLATLQFDGAH